MELNKVRELAMGYHGKQQYANKPYIIHLDLVQRMAEEHKALLLNDNDQKYNLPLDFWKQINQLCYVHDALEDTELTEYQLSQDTSSEVAGKAKKLSLNYSKHIDDYFQRISTDMVTTYVKLCDRLANIIFSLENPGPKSDKVLAKYRSEQPILYSNLIRYTSLLPMVDKIDHLLKK